MRREVEIAKRAIFAVAVKANVSSRDTIAFVQAVHALQYHRRGVCTGVCGLSSGGDQRVQYRVPARALPAHRARRNHITSFFRQCGGLRARTSAAHGVATGGDEEGPKVAVIAARDRPEGMLTLWT